MLRCVSKRYSFASLATFAVKGFLVRLVRAVLPGRKNAPLTIELTTGRGSTKFNVYNLTRRSSASPGLE